MLEDSNPVDDFDGQDPLSLLKKLQSLLAKKEMEKLREEIWLAFAAFENPLEWLLDVLEASSDWKGKGHSLAYNIAHELQFWIKEHPNGQLSGLRLRKLQSRVFPVLAQSQINLLDLLISIYHLHDADRYHLLGHINHLYHEDKFKEAVVLSIKLKLQPDLDVEKMCVPLLLQDKMNLVESYVEEYPDLQQQLLRLLDSWCEPGFRTETITKQYQGVPNIRPEKVNRKLLSKLIFRFLDKYSLDPALCPNTINQRHLGTLKYLLYKRFVEKTMTQENWTDHVQCTIGNNRWLQEQLVQLLASYCRLNAAATWALHYSLPEDSLPCRVADELKALKSQKRDDAVKQKEANCEEWRKDHYYQLPIPREDVLILSTWEEVQKCKEHVLQPGQVVGIDMEWRPSFGAVGEKSRVSLVQMAVHGQVFLLDMLQLLNQDGNNEEALSSFFQTLFADPTITKLGYGMSGDLHSLGLTCTGFKDLDKHLSGVLDLLAVHKQLPKSSGAVKKGSRKVNALPWEDEAERCGRLPEKGLSLLVQHVLGKPLDKTEQLSNWEKRPLREGQILYAALDAYCLLEIYTKLQNDLAGFGLNPDILTLQPKKVCPEVRAKKLPRKQRMPPACNEESAANVKENPSSSVSILVSDFRVVCDNMLQGLGRHLRCLGVDVRMLENDDDHRKAAELARQEDRVILTSGLPYQTLRSQVGEGRCFSVDCSEKAKEQALRVLKHFNVQVTLADVFSRCQDQELGKMDILHEAEKCIQQSRKHEEAMLSACKKPDPGGAATSTVAAEREPQKELKGSPFLPLESSPALGQKRAAMEETAEQEEHPGAAEDESPTKVTEGEPVGEVVQEMTLDEWKNLQEQNRPKPEFNIRKPETLVPSKAVVIHKSKYRDDDVLKEDFEDDIHFFRKAANDITSQLDINFGNLPRPGRGARRARGGRGRVRRVQNLGPRPEVTVHITAPNPDDPDDFPALA